MKYYIKLLKIFFLLLMICFYCSNKVIARTNQNIADSNVSTREYIEFNQDRWILKNAEVKEHLGRKALEGNAYLKDVVFENGIIEVDIATEHKRSYPGINFRIQSESASEHIYLRPHRAGYYSDAIQYAPVFNGVDSWQLYNGIGFTADVPVPADQWIHIRVEVMGTQARVFVGDAVQPALVINDLKYGKSHGTLGLSGPRDGTAYFSNFSYTNTDSLRFIPPPQVELPCGLMTNWLLSQPFRSFLEEYPNKQIQDTMQWTPIQSEPSGLVDITRYRKPLPSGRSMVWAKTILHADKKESIQMAFGYSDMISIYLNGQILFRGNSAYQRRDPSFLGIIGWNDAVFLPLKPGENELMLLISDFFGGWGFQCRNMNSIYQHKNLKKIWELAGKLRKPESAAYDKKRNVLYISNFGDECISKVGMNGELLAYKWIGGLNLPLGIRIFRDKLYVVERTGVAEIDLENRRIINRYPIAEIGFINDLTLDEQGNIYVTDSPNKRIYKITQGKSEIWLESSAITDPNGIIAEKEHLMIGVSSDGSLKTADLRTKKVTTFLSFNSYTVMDGLVSDGKGGYLFSDFSGRIYHADVTGQKTLLLNRTGPQQFCADFEYDPVSHLLIVPSLDDNRLTAYKYQPDER